MACVACGCIHKEAPKQEPSVTKTEIAETKAESVETPSPPPNAPAKPEMIESEIRALVLQDGALAKMGADGKTERIVAAPGVTECELDRVHHVVWLISDAQISAYDPDDAAVHPVVAVPSVPEDARDLTWRVRYVDDDPAYPRATAGNADGLDDCAALVLGVDDPPSLGGATVAEGDRVVYCTDDDEDSDADVPNAQTRAEISVYNEAKLVDPQFVSALRTRRSTRPVRARPRLEAPPAPKVAVDASNCIDSPEDCGEATYLGGRLWSVVTANDRGDFFYEDTQLYDAETQSFWNPDNDTRTPEPVAEHDVGSFPVSPDGRWALYGEKILSLQHATVVGSYGGSFCGWEDP
jgi:hypothetical protein